MPKSIMAESMTFPLLTVNEIVSCSDELCVLIQTADLKTPHAGLHSCPALRQTLAARGVWTGARPEVALA